MCWWTIESVYHLKELIYQPSCIQFKLSNADIRPAELIFRGSKFWDIIIFGFFSFFSFFSVIVNQLICRGPGATFIKIQLRLTCSGVGEISASQEFPSTFQLWKIFFSCDAKKLSKLGSHVFSNQEPVCTHWAPEEEGDTHCTELRPWAGEDFCFLGSQALFSPWVGGSGTSEWCCQEVGLPEPWEPWPRTWAPVLLCS